MKQNRYLIVDSQRKWFEFRNITLDHVKSFWVKCHHIETGLEGKLCVESDGSFSVRYSSGNVHDLGTKDLHTAVRMPQYKYYIEFPPGCGPEHGLKPELTISIYNAEELLRPVRENATLPENLAIDISKIENDPYIMGGLTQGLGSILATYAHITPNFFTEKGLSDVAAVGVHKGIDPAVVDDVIENMKGGGTTISPHPDHVNTGFSAPDREDPDRFHTTEND
jgi:hypothetical protein